MQAFSAERASWRAVIQLNVVRSIHVILDAMTHPSQPRHDPRKQMTSSASSSPLSGEIPLPEDTSDVEPELIQIRYRLSSLLQVEDSLTRQLTPKDYSEVGTTQLAPMNHIKHVATELAINSSVPWKQRFDRLVGKGDTERMIIDWDDPNDPGKILHAVREPHLSSLASVPIMFLSISAGKTWFGFGSIQMYNRCLKSKTSDWRKWLVCKFGVTLRINISWWYSIFCLFKLLGLIIRNNCRAIPTIRW